MTLAADPPSYRALWRAWADRICEELLDVHVMFGGVTQKRWGSWNCPDFSHISVLIIEDDPDSREFLREVLRSCGAAVMETDNIATAKDCVSNSKFDLIVTDLALPGEHGAAFLKWLRKQPREKGGDTLTVAVTAYYEDYPPAKVSGWAAYFQKPVDPGQFVRTVASLLKVPLGDG